MADAVQKLLTHPTPQLMLFVVLSLPVKLYPGKLTNGYSHCILFSAGGDGSFLTPCKYE